MDLLAPSLIIQLILIVHVLRSGRPIYWVFIIFFVPVIGSLAYFFVEILPELSQNYTARRTVRRLHKTIDPGADLRRKQQAYEASGSIDSTRHLAEELTRNQQFDAAIELYTDALSGLYEHDPTLLLGLAEAQFGKQDFQSSRTSLDKLFSENPQFKTAEGNLLYARCFEELGDLDVAEKKYAAVAAYFAGAEAGLRYGNLLEKIGKPDLATKTYEDLLRAADLAPRHYRRAQKQWLDAARKQLQTIQRT